MRSRLNCLTELIDVTRGRVPDELTGRAGKTLERAGQRLRWGEQTIVALAGSTGSGKSSLTNALVGSDVAEAGVLRPTTAETLAVSFGNTNAELLDWLRVGHRQEVPAGQDGFGGLVLLDLPDHDSMVSSHRAEVDRIVPVVDQFIWVLDPQKYADAAVHHGYLRPLSRHGEVMAVVLNQVDRIRAADLDDCLAHLGQLLDSDGLAGVFTYGAVLAKLVFGFSTGEVIVFGVVANVVAGLATIVFGHLDDRTGPKRVILISLGALVGLGSCIFLLHDRGPVVFWIFGIAMTLFVGPAQSASRSFLARLIPEGHSGEVFGLYATTGRAVSFLASSLWVLSLWLGSFLVPAGESAVHFGILGIVLVLAAGLVVMIPVREAQQVMHRG